MCSCTSRSVQRATPIDAFPINAFSISLTQTFVEGRDERHIDLSAGGASRESELDSQQFTAIIVFLLQQLLEWKY